MSYIYLVTLPQGKFRLYPFGGGAGFKKRMQGEGLLGITSLAAGYSQEGQPHSCSAVIIGWLRKPLGEAQEEPSVSDC